MSKQFSIFSLSAPESRQGAGLSNLRLFETGTSEFLISLVVMVRKKGAKID